MTLANRATENVRKCKYLGTTPINQKCILKIIKERLISGNDFCDLIWNLVFSTAI
jgi:hypothetical protein